MRFQDRLEGIRSGIIKGPVHVQIILSDLCNQACHFCAYRDPGYTSSQLFHVNGNYNPNRMLPFEKVIEILDDCKEMGVKAIQLTGGGEPTIHPRFGEVLDAIRERGMQWALVTNGVMQKWNLEGAAWIRVSLDAAFPETYTSIRNAPKQHFEKACETIKRYKCGVGFVVTPENWTEIVEAAMLVKNLGASSIRIGAQFSEEGTEKYEGIAVSAANLARLAEGLSTDTFEVVNRFTEKLSELDQGSPEYSLCGYQHFTTYIGADQNLYRCCVYAYNPRGLIGSIKGKRFKDVWFDLAQEDFRKFNAQGCKRCQFNAINRNILQAIAWSPSDDFV